MAEEQVRTMHQYKILPPTYDGNYSQFEEWKYRFAAYAGISNGAFSTTLDLEHKQWKHCHQQKLNFTPSALEHKKRSSSGTSSWKRWTQSPSTCTSTQTAQQASPWQQDKEYQNEQNTSNSNSCSSRTSSKEAWYHHTRYQSKITGQTSSQCMWQQKCWDGSYSEQASTLTEAKLQQVSPVSPVCM